MTGKVEWPLYTKRKMEEKNDTVPIQYTILFSFKKLHLWFTKGTKLCFLLLLPTVGS